MNRNFGYIKDKNDSRDFLARIPVKINELPLVVDPFDSSNRVEDQGQLGSCTGHGVTTALEVSLNTSVQYSRLMAYYNAREIEGTINEDAGAQIRDVVKGLLKTGVCTENSWPYIENKFNITPDQVCYDEALEQINEVTIAGLTYSRCISLEDVLFALSNKQPVIIGYYVTEQIYKLPSSGIYAKPSKTAKFIGGHCSVVMGYDISSPTASKRFVWVKNSWGWQWGLNGYFKMPISWFKDKRALVDDMWTISKA
jgi:C1A family cysteine protease